MDDEDQTQEGALDTAGEAMGYEFPDEFLPDTSGLAEPELGVIPYARQQYEAAKGKTETSFREVLNQINAAKQRLLAQPTQLDRKQYLQGLATKLTTPPERTDPRFYERRNLYTFLRDVGQYGAEQEAAQRAAKLKQAEEVGKLDQLAAKYGFEAAQKGEAEAATLLARAREAAAVKKPTSEFERLIANMPPEEQTRMRRMRAIALATEAKGKSEPDPDRPSSTVIARVQQFSNRNLSPVKAKLDAVNQAKLLLNEAYTNPAATGQVDRYMAKLVGDSQLSSLEVKAISNVGSLPTRISDKISLFLSGTRTDLSLDDKKKILDAIEEYLGPQYNAQHDKVLDAFSAASDISPTAVSRILGGRYMTEAERRRRKQAESKSKEAPPAEPKKPEEAETHTTQKGNVVKKIG